MTRFPLLLALIMVMTGTSSAQAQGIGRGSVAEPIEDWPSATSDSLGLHAEAIELHAARCLESEASACLIAYKGYLVQEWYAPDYDGRPLALQPWIATRSATKSVVGLLAALLLDDRKIDSLDQPVSAFIPEWTAGADAGVTIRHLMSMTSSVARHDGSGPRPGVVAVRNTTDFVLGLPLQGVPGEHWQYSNESAQLLSPVLERAAGMPLAAYARERLFDPLGMTTSYMRVDEYYNTVTIGGLMTRLREFARIGQLLANRGMWNGVQIVSNESNQALTTPTPQNPGYGLLWWLNEAHGAIMAAGTFDQVLTIIPDLDLVALRLQRDVESRRNQHYWNAETLALLREIVE